MRRDKTFAQILLIFSIAHVVIAAPAVVQQRSLVRGVPDSGSTDELALSLGTASDVSETPPPPSQAASLHEPRAGSEQNPALATPPPPPATEHQDWTPSHGSLSNVPLSQDLAPSHDAESRLQPPQWKLVQSADTPMSGSGAPSSSHPGHGTPGGATPEHDDFKISEWGVHGLYNKPAPWQNDRYPPHPEDEIGKVADKVESPKGFCGLRCFKLPFNFHPRSFINKSSPERDHGHRFSWGVSFYPLSSLSSSI